MRRYKSIFRSQYHSYMVAATGYDPVSAAYETAALPFKLRRKSISQAFAAIPIIDATLFFTMGKIYLKLSFAQRTINKITTPEKIPARNQLTSFIKKTYTSSQWSKKKILAKPKTTQTTMITVISAVPILIFLIPCSNDVIIPTENVPNFRAVVIYARQYSPIRGKIALRKHAFNALRSYRYFGKRCIT